MDQALDWWGRQGDQWTAPVCLPSTPPCHDPLCVPPPPAPHLHSTPQAMLSALNPSAKLLTTTHSEVQPSEVLLTGLWEAHKAQGGAAWVQLMRHADSSTPPQQTADRQQQQQQGGHAHDCSTPRDGSCSHHHQHSSSSDTAAAAAGSAVGVGGSGSCPCCPAAAAPASRPSPGSSSSSRAVAAAATRPTSSYGVCHFVYRARLPFHPGRLHDFMVKFFILQEPDWSRMLGGGGAGTEGDDSSSQSESESESGEAAAGTAAGEKDGTSGNGVQQQQQATSVQVLQAVAGERRVACEGAFGVLLRSKGFVWLATRGDHIGEWSQAGSLLSFSTGAQHLMCCWQGCIYVPCSLLLLVGVGFLPVPLLVTD